MRLHAGACIWPRRSTIHKGVRCELERSRGCISQWARRPWKATSPADCRQKCERRVRLNGMGCEFAADKLTCGLTSGCAMQPLASKLVSAGRCMGLEEKAILYSHNSAVLHAVGQAQRARVACAKFRGAKRATRAMAQMAKDGVIRTPDNVAKSLKKANLTSAQLARTLMIMGIKSKTVGAALHSAGVSRAQGILAKLPATMSPYIPSRHPTSSPTRPPTARPTRWPTLTPSVAPSYRPTHRPTAFPTPKPTSRPPTSEPTDVPTQRPTYGPTELPTTSIPTSALFGSISFCSISEFWPFLYVRSLSLYLVLSACRIMSRCPPNSAVQPCFVGGCQ